MTRKAIQFILLLSLAAPGAIAQNTVTISTPANNSTVASPVTVAARATSVSPYTVRAMKIYLDGTSVFSINAASFTTSVTMSAGAVHRLAVQAWNSHGDVYKTVYYVVVPSASPGSNAVSISTPANNSTVSNPVTVSASATSVSPYTVRTMKIYLDGTSVFSIGASSFTTSLTMSAGATHRLAVQAWNSHGDVYKSVYYVTVPSSSTSHSVALKWQASTGQNITYKVYRGSTSGGPYSLLANSIPSLTYTDTSVTSGSTYYYVVTAFDGSKESVYSNEARATIP